MRNVAVLPSVPGAPPAGSVYARTLFNADPNGPVYTFLPGFCDPPPVSGFESEHIFRIDLTIDPPIRLNKNRRYWLDVQSMFPFADELRDSLQTWWMLSQNNTLLRGRTQRSNNVGYLPT